MKKYFASSELIINEDGSVFHLHVKPEWLADKVILVGDPGRVALVASHFETKECEVESREFKTITGTYKGKRITVVSTGIGCDNIDIVMNADTDTVVTGEGDDEKIYTLARSEITGWTIVGCMNMAELLKSSKEANNIYVMTAIVLVVIAMLISSFIARSITLPIQKLRDSMERVQEGDFKAADDLVDENLVVPDDVTKGEIVQNVSQEAEQEYNKIWTEFKAACD